MRSSQGRLDDDVDKGTATTRGRLTDANQASYWDARKDVKRQLAKPIKKALKGALGCQLKRVEVSSEGTSQGVVRCGGLPERQRELRTSATGKSGIGGNRREDGGKRKTDRRN